MSRVPWAGRLAGLFCAISSATACPYESNSPLLKLRTLADLAIVRVQTLGDAACTGSGTGFLIGPAGHILTAGHVVPRECDGRSTITAYWSRPSTGKMASEGVPLQVIQRSTLDVALLKPANPLDASRQYLAIESITDPDTSYRGRCLLLASHYLDAWDTLLSFAEIGSVQLIGNPSLWALQGEGFNASRSGSPLISDNGKVLAVFLARPGQDSERAKAVENRAYILPLARLPKSEIDLDAVGMAAGTVTRFPQVVASPERPLVSRTFGVSHTERGPRLNGPFVVIKGSMITRAASLQEALLKLATGAAEQIGSEISVEKTFVASPGKIFDVTKLRWRVASQNPRDATLPSSPCSNDLAGNCYKLGADGRTLEVRLQFYPGVDARSSWIDAELDVLERDEIR